MKYELDFENSFDKSMLFWLSRFIRSKLNTLSNSKVTSPQTLTTIIARLRVGVDSIDELKQLSKDARNIGLIGINTYINPLSKLYEYLSKMGFASLKEVDEEILIDFLASATSSLSDATKKNYRIALLGFFGFIDKNNGDDISGVAHRFGIELKNFQGKGRSGEKLPSYMAQAELKRFLEAIDTVDFGEKFTSRNRLLIKTILYSGMRVSEALQLKTKDVIKDGDTYVFKIKGKGNIERIAMIKVKYLISDMAKWLDSAMCDNNLLFCNKNRTTLSQSYVSKIMDKILGFANIRKEKNGAHMLRHTFATLLYQTYHDIVLIKEALGHASTNTSMIYTHFDKQRLKAASEVMDKL
jgi:integrase/recombinase XerD